MAQGFNSYNIRRDGRGREFAQVAVDSQNHGFRQVLLDRADLDRYLDQIGSAIYLGQDDRGIGARFAREGREYQLHRWVMLGFDGYGGDQVVVAADGNLLDCRRSNLEVLSRSAAGHRAQYRHKSSGLPQGVALTRRTGKPYMARIKLGDKQVYLGSYETPEEAHQAYLQAKRDHGLT